MAAQALYLKYRPQAFDEVVGQEAITRTLRNALRHGRVRHAYLFTGTRGTGKTTMARLLAKAVNCLAPEDQRPCNSCALCTALNEGRLLDLIEIDAASNRGIDEIRDIREKVGFHPNEGRYKVYVLDEAHMLTEPAFNALLKTLEEPPPHVIFILVTTDPQKIPATIASRCQRFDFRRIPVQDVIGRMAYVAAQEGLQAEPEALEMIARQGTGAMRDALSLLDQLTSYGDEITLAQVQMVLGTVGGEAAARVVACLADRDLAAGLDWIDRTVADGAEPRQFGHEIVQYLRSVLLVHEGAGTRLLNATAEQAAEVEVLAARLPLLQLTRAIRLFNEATTDLRRGFQTIPQLPLEMALVESILEAEPSPPALSQGQTGSRAAGTGAPQGEPEASTQAAGEDAAPVVQEEPAGPARAVTEVSPRATPAQQPAVRERPQAAAAGGPLLGQVVSAWQDILQAVRHRNPTTYGALNTDCRPVEVDGDEVVVTFPYAILRDKLEHPERKSDIQDALSEILRARCRVRFVLAADFRPQQKPARTEPGSEPAAPRSGPEPAEPAARANQADGELDMDQIHRWARGVGGQVVEG
jgi:DNA polymerase III subunit gamma/tau